MFKFAIGCFLGMLVAIGAMTAVLSRFTTINYSWLPILAILALVRVPCIMNYSDRSPECFRIFWTGLYSGVIDAILLVLFLCLAGFTFELDLNGDTKMYVVVTAFCLAFALPIHSSSRLTIAAYRRRNRQLVGAETIK